MHWTTTDIPDEKAATLGEALEASPRLGALLLRLGLDEPESARQFLHCRLGDLDDPFAISHMEEAVARLRQALAQNQSVFVLGDYDVDGVTSTSLFVGMLRKLGLSPRYFVPLREGEGYGISEATLERMLAEGQPDLFVALDCGTNAAKLLESLHERGIDTLVVDHHQAKENLPEQGVLVNPHLFDEPSSPWRHLCTVGLVFKLVHGLVKRLREEDHPAAMELTLRHELDLVALGTIADLVPLQDENRVLTRFGLGEMQRTSRPGLRALLDQSGIKEDVPLMPSDVSFRLSPRINASGRLADATLPVEMLLSRDAETCRQLAHELDLLNRERQDIEKRITEEAHARVERDFSDAAGVVLYDEDWHHGVVGIVAGKLTQSLQRPCFVLGREGEQAKGSGRSLPGLNLVEALGRCSELLGTWGGHPPAAGVALPVGNVGDFQQAFDQAVRELLEKKSLESPLDIACWVRPEELGSTLLGELDLLHPFGMANPEPIFGVASAILRREPQLFGQKHFRFWVPTEGRRSVAGVAWRKADCILPVGEPVDLALKLAWNHWNGRSLPQVELIDWRYPETDAASKQAG